MFVPAFTVQWSYVAMTSRMTAVDQTSGEFGFTRKDEWQIVPKRTAKQWRTYLGPFRRDGGTFSLVGSIHLATYEIRTTGPSTCHVRLLTTKLRTSSFDFDLSASSQDVVGTLERLGDGTVKHPWYPQDEGPYQRDVIQGDLTTVKFEKLAN